MKRRDFIMGVGGVAAMPLAAHAQAQPATPVIGFLRDTTRSGSEYLFAALSNGLREVGLIEGQDFFIEFGWGEGRRERLPALAADFARRPVSVIVASTTSAAVAAKAATTTVPVVFVFPGDPIEFNLVASINRPGGNITGVSYLNTELALLWQIYSRRCSLQIHFRQCGHRCGGGRAMSSRMAWRTAGKVG